MATSIGPRTRDLTGVRFGKRTVVEYAGKDHHGHAQWACRCDCGKLSIARADALRRGSGDTCGCRDSRFIHGNPEHPSYITWKSMINRCCNPNHPNYKNYGGRGITICEAWRDFRRFAADMGERPTGYTIERTDNDGGYTPENCKWATCIEQHRNTRANRFIEYRGRKITVAELAEIAGLKHSTVTRRLNNGWSVEDAATVGLRERNRWTQ